MPYGGRARAHGIPVDTESQAAPAPLYRGGRGPSGLVRACNCGYSAQIYRSGLHFKDLMVGLRRSRFADFLRRSDSNMYKLMDLC